MGGGRLERLYGRLSVPGSPATDFERLGSVDLIRAVAAVSVLLSHALVLPAVSEGRAVSGLPFMASLSLSAGVFLFFALSGYLIAGPFLRALTRERAFPSGAGYAIRRSVRILPAYWVALIAAILLIEPALRLGEVLMHATLTFGPVLTERGRYISIGWTLGVEALFYAFVPLAALAAYRLARRRPVRVETLVLGVLGVWAFSAVWAIGWGLADPLSPGGVSVGEGIVHTGFGLIEPLYHFCPGILVFLLLHPAGADRRHRLWRGVAAARAHPFALLGAAAVLWVVTAVISRPGESEAAQAAIGQINAVACGLILFGVLCAGPRLRPAILAAAPIGLISYGVYLWHGVLFDALVHEGGTLLSDSLGPAGFAARAAVFLAVALPLGALSWLLIERPLLRRTTGWNRRGAQVAGVGAVYRTGTDSPA